MTMTIHIAWWVTPLALFGAGLIGAVVFASRSKEWDFFTPMLALCCLVAGTASALAFIAGRLFA